MKKTFLIKALALLLAMGAMPALAAQGTVLRNERLYSQPSATSKVTATAAKGASVTILAKRGGWLQ
ncbi:MAG: SH3 domain-containing protein, partial [Thiobacillus sp.]